MKDSWTYMLECSDGSYYVGSMTNLQKRISEHQSGEYGGYTASRHPVRLVWSARFSNINDAIAAERQIKGWSRAKKRALIKSDFDLLHELSRSTATKRKSKSAGSARQ
jgi:predicted GIY-YIG superfamily endonuclease